ncbi:MAG: hypothetical protein ACPHY8_05200 [Patescibacteria group bacterium]
MEKPFCLTISNIFSTSPTHSLKAAFVIFTKLIFSLLFTISTH